MNQEEYEKWIDKKQQEFWTDFFIIVLYMVTIPK